MTLSLGSRPMCSPSLYYSHAVAAQKWHRVFEHLVGVLPVGSSERRALTVLGASFPPARSSMVCPTLNDVVRSPLGESEQAFIVQTLSWGRPPRVPLCLPGAVFCDVSLTKIYLLSMPHQMWNIGPLFRQQVTMDTVCRVRSIYDYVYLIRCSHSNTMQVNQNSLFNSMYQLCPCRLPLHHKFTSRDRICETRTKSAEHRLRYTR